MVTDQSNDIPKWLARHLTRDDLAKVSAAIRQAEVTTSGEIVPMIVRRSAFVGHVFPMTVLTLFLIYVSCVGAGLLAPLRTGFDPYLTIPDLMFLTLVALGLSRLRILQRLFTDSTDRDAAVHRRAELEFYQAGLQKTKDATGILLFLSYAERRAVVLADKTIAAKLPPETWNRVLEHIISGIKKDALADGLVAAIAACGELVRPHFPLQSDDRNELKDVIVIKD